MKVEMILYIMLELFKPVILEDISKINQLENGNMAFDTTDRKIFVKMDNKIESYGGLTESEINNIVNNIIANKELELRWSIITNDDNPTPDPDPNPPTPTNDPTITITPPSLIKRGIETQFSYTTENVPEGTNIEFTATCGSMTHHEVNVLVDTQNNKFIVAPEYSGDDALTINVKILDKTFSFMYAVESNPEITITINAPENTVINTPCEIRFYTSISQDVDPALINNDLNIYLNQEELIIITTINDVAQHFTVDDYNNNPATNKYSTLTVTPNAVGTMIITMSGNKNGATKTVIKEINVTAAE